MIQAARRVLFSPSRTSFEDIRSHANFGRAILFAAGAGLAAGALGATINLFSANGSLADIVVFALFNAIRFVVALLVTQALLFALAASSGGHGSFETQAYLGSLYNVPLTFVGVLGSGLNGLTPGTGYVFSALILLYQILLTVPMLRAVHGLEWRASLGAVAAMSFVGNLGGALVSLVLPQ